MESYEIQGAFESEISFPYLSYEIRHSFAKRAFDIVFSLCAFTLGLPIFLGVAIAVMMSSQGKVIFSHERIGRGGQTFRCYKFRTMYLDAEERLKELIEKDPAIKEEWLSNFKLKNDPRVTPVGNFLRKTSLDELPQFWNVLKGDLSVVGPRPVVHEELRRHFGSKANKILSIRPGLTGLWQVSGRSDTGYATRIALDEKYAEERSLLLDIKIIAKTFAVMFSTKGAY